LGILSKFLRRGGPGDEGEGVEVPGEVIATKEIGPGTNPAEVLKDLAKKGDGVVVAGIEFGRVTLVIASARSWSKAVFVNSEYLDPLKGFEDLEEAVAKGREYRVVLREASRAEVEEFMLAAGAAVIDDPLPIIEQVVRQAILKSAARVSGWGIDSSLCGAEEVFLSKIYPHLRKAVDKDLSEELAGRKLREAAMMLPKELVSVADYPALAEKAVKALKGEAPPLLIELRIYPSRARLDKAQTTIAYFLITKGRAGVYVEYFDRSKVFEALKGKKALKSFASRAKDDLRKGRCGDYDVYTFVTTPPAEVSTKTVREGP